MDNILIFIGLTFFSFSGYLIWPSRYNVFSHGAVASGFISIIVPVLILHVPEKYDQTVVNLYVMILSVGILFYFPFLIAGFIIGKRMRTHFTFDLIPAEHYEKRVIIITKTFLIIGIVGLAVSYMVMGFIPVFAEDPIAAKLFRGPYQEPYYKVAALFRSAWFILTAVIPIACIIAYRNRSLFFSFLILIAVFLMIASLQRSGAFGGIVFAFILIMSFKSKGHFALLMVILIGTFVMSSFFYYIVGVRTFSSEKDVWEVIGESSPDLRDQLYFLTRFNENPIYTYGRTLYGGFIPGHYKWNPSVYTLSIIDPGKDINETGSGGLRLGLPLWGYVSFSWPGVIFFSLLTGFFNGIFFGIIKQMLRRFDSIIIRTTALISFGNVFGLLSGFTLLSFYNIPLALIGLLYLYRFRLK